MAIDIIFSCICVIVCITIYKLLDWLIHRGWVAGLAGRYVMITGCDSGFGHLSAKRFDQLGCHVFAACLTQDGVIKLKNACSSRLTAFTMDVTKQRDVDVAYDIVRDALPEGCGLWALINNAGAMGRFGQSDWLTKQDYVDAMDVNFFGLVSVTARFLPLIKLARGRVINTSSIIARFRLPGTNPYTASKCAVSGYSDGLRREMHNFGISVHTIEPGVHKTNFMKADKMEEALRDVWSDVPEAVQQEYGDAYIEQAVRVMIDQCVHGITASDLSPVVDCYLHAALAVRPRARYTPGRDAALLWVPLSLLPDGAADTLLYYLGKASGVPDPLVAQMHARGLNFYHKSS